MWGTVRKLLASGWAPDGHFSGIPDSGSGKSGKTGKPEKLHMTYQIKALGKLVNVVALKIRISGFRIRKNRKTGKIHMTYQIKAVGKLVNVVALKIRISGFRIRKNRKITYDLSN